MLAGRPITTHENGRPAPGAAADAVALSTAAARPCRRNLAIAALLALCVFLVFGRTASHEFLHYDDPYYVFTNPHVQGGLTWQNVAWALRSLEESNWHPLTWMSHMLDVSLFGLRPGPHHLVNVAFHAATAALLFLTFNAMTGAARPSALVAALFAIHPLHVESVAWIAERKDVLSAFLGVLSLAAYAAYARRPGPARYLLAALLLALGLAAKPMLVTFPLLFLLLDWWPLGRLRVGGEPRTRLSSVARLLLEKAPLLALAAGSAVVTYVAQKGGGTLILMDATHQGTRLANSLVSCARYLGKTLWPRDLAVFYPIAMNVIPSWQVAAIGAGLVAATLLVLLGSARRPHLLAGWSWFLLTLLPVIGLVKAGPQAFADRYTYLPIVGLFVGAAWALEEAVGRFPRWRPAAWTAVGLLLALLAGTSWVQTGHWKNTLTLFGHAAAVTPDNGFAHFVLGRTLSRAARYDEADGHFQEAIRDAPWWAEAHLERGMNLTRAGKGAEGLRWLREALRLAPADWRMHYRLGVALQLHGRPQEALSHIESAIRLDPGNAEARERARALRRELSLQ